MCWHFAIDRTSLLWHIAIIENEEQEQTMSTTSETAAVFEIKHRWNGLAFKPVSFTRKASPRADQNKVRAKLVRTANQSRRIEVFITADLVKRLGWKVGGSVAPAWCVGEANLLMTLTPAHKGPAVSPVSKKTTTCRVAIHGDFIAKSQCARIREVEFTLDKNSLFIALPIEWAASAPVEA